MIFNIILKNIPLYCNYEIFILLNTVLTKSLKVFNLNKSTTFSTFLIKPIQNRKLSINSKWKQFTMFDNMQPNKWSIKDSNVNYLFALYLKFAHGDGSNFVIHADYKYMFMCNDNVYITPFLDIYRFHKKWMHSYDLLINLFFVNTQIFAFSSKLLKEETLSFNWSFNIIPYTLFKQSSPYFFLKDATHGARTNFIFKLLGQYGLHTAFIADTKYQKKTLFHLRRSGVHTIGLVPYTISPWIVNYAIPAASNTLFTQYFFIKLLTYIRQQAECYKFENLKSIWYIKEKF